MNSERLLHALCYLLWPLSLAIILVERKDKLRRFHAWNGLGFAIAAFLISIPLWAFAFIPFFGSAMMTLYWFAVVVTAFILAFEAYEGRKVRIPYVTDFLKKNVKDF